MVKVWVPGMDTCSRIATVVPAVSLIKGGRDSEHRDWNTSLKSRALAWPWRVWVNMPKGMAELIREQRLDDTRVPMPISGISVSTAGPLNVIFQDKGRADASQRLSGSRQFIS